MHLLLAIAATPTWLMSGAQITTTSATLTIPSRAGHYAAPLNEATGATSAADEYAVAYSSEPDPIVVWIVAEPVEVVFAETKNVVVEVETEPVEVVYAVGDQPEEVLVKAETPADTR